MAKNGNKAQLLVLGSWDFGRLPTVRERSCCPTRAPCEKGATQYFPWLNTRVWQIKLPNFRTSVIEEAC